MAAKSPPPLSPFIALTIGLVILLASAALNRVPPIPLARELTLFAGTALLLVGLVTRLRTAGWDWRDRVETAAYLSSASAIAAGMVVAGINPSWGSARLLYSAASLFGFGATLLVLLPTGPRKVLLSLWIVFHFGGMFTSYTSIDPPGNQGPFLAKHLWTYLYRPYLSFLYMTNAYHFYSPDPGPPNLLWLAVHYSDGSYTWVRLPTREKGQIGMHYQRVLALPEHSFSANPRWPLTQGEVAGLPKNAYPEERIWENIYERRVRGSTVLYPLRDVKTGEVKGRYPIPLPADLDVRAQYSEPNDTSKKMIRGVAMKVMRDAPKQEGVEVRSVKVYRVTHHILSMYELAKGVSPYLRPKYSPIFLGEFNTAGELVNPLDPFLYWYVPIVNVPSKYPNHGIRDPQSGAPMLAVRVQAAEPNFELDGLEMHAGGPGKEKE